jgi:hypothetical protein
LSDKNAEALVEALIPIERDLDEAVQVIETALAQLGTLPDLKMEEEDLLQEDTTQLARVAYVTCLLRLASAIRAQPRSLDQELRQGNLALGYVKHVEGSNVKVLQLGRRSHDKKLAHEIAVMRSKLASVADYKKANPKVDETILDLVPQKNEEG